MKMIFSIFVFSIIIFFISSFRFSPHKLYSPTSNFSQFSQKASTIIVFPIFTILYSLISFWFFDFCLTHTDCFLYFKTFSFAYFCYLGLSMVIFEENYSKINLSTLGSFLYEFIILLFNPLFLVFPFSLLAFFHLPNDPIVITFPYKLSFIFGCLVGVTAFYIVFYLFLFKIYRKYLPRINFFLGIFFCILAIIEMYGLIDY